MRLDVQTLIAAGNLARREHRLPEAKTAFNQAIDELRDADPPTRHLAEALRGLGQIERDLGEVDAALEHHQQAANLFHALGMPQAWAHTIRHVADIQRESGDFGLASANYCEALLLYRSDPDTRAIDLANTLRGHALLKGATRDREAAIADWKEARMLYEQAASQTGMDMQPAYDEIAMQIARLSVREATPD